VRDLVTDSGWRQAPRLRDLTELSLGDSVFQIDGTVVPVADVNLASGDSVFFEHHVMLWKDEGVAMSVMTAPGGMKRLLGTLPFVLSVAHGPGRISFSRDAPGEVVVLPVDPGLELDVREHGMIVASSSLTYSFEKLPGLQATLATGSGMYLDRFVAAQDAGGSYRGAVTELRAGRKTTHWMWYVFPQIAGLGQSPTSKRYAISSMAEARAYLAHPVLGPRLLECAGILAALSGRTAEDVLGGIDAMKLRSSMTLFRHAAPDQPVFSSVLDRYFGGEPDPATERLIGHAG